MIYNCNETDILQGRRFRYATIIGFHNDQMLGFHGDRLWDAAILRGEPLIADGREGINGLMLSNAMHMSDWLGKAVELPLDEDLYYEELMKRVKTSRRKTTEVKTVVADMDSTYGSKITEK